MLAIVAATTLLVSYDSSIKATEPARESEAARAVYLAQAAMQHALWRAGNNACMGDVTIPATALGLDNYAATITGAAAGTAYTLIADQDAWIRSDDVTQNNGTTTDQHLRFESGISEHALFRFDLSALTANVQINSATAWFYITPSGPGGGAHPEGPVTVHRVTEDWTETGATWDTMNGNFESSALATIPAQPDDAVWVQINLTAQVQAWANGQPNYGILMTSAAEGVHGKYVSREGAANEQPYIEVVVGSGPASPVSIQATGTLANGVTRTLSRPLTAAYQPPVIHTFSPGPAESNDAEIWDQAPTNNYGDAAETWVSSASNDTTLSLLRFNIGAIPAGARILEAALFLHRQSGSGAEQPVSAHRIMNPWSEDAVTWNSREAGTNWDTAGGDFNSIAIATTPVGPGNQRYEWDVTPLVQGWADGRYPNYGVVLTAAIDGMTGERFYTSDQTILDRRPGLSVTYACECGNACMAPNGSGNVLMVVGDPTIVDPEDAYKKALFEAWGYTVNLQNDNAGQTSFDGKFTTNDVVYISETVDSIILGTKVSNAPIGVVNEDGWMNDELGIESANSSNWPVGNSITITDTSHYITLPFIAGSLPIYTADMGGLAIGNTPAPGLQSLADWGTDTGLAVLESGALTAGGGAAAGRRVMLPFGRDILIDWSRLNNSGQLILQRAIAWAADIEEPAAPGPGLWLSTLDDVSSSGAPGLDAWTDGEVIGFDDPNLSLEPATNGTFSSILNLDNFTSDADIDAIHYVGSNITVGSANSVDLLPGDVLLSTANDETLTSNNTISVKDNDVFVFRPDTAGDYSVGTFIFLLEGEEIDGEPIVAVSLVEKDTVVGDGSLQQGDFIVGVSNRRDVIEFAANDVGLGTTSGSANEFIDGPSLSLDSEIRGIDLAEDEVTIGGHTIPSGAILLTLRHDDSGGVGDNLVPAVGEDVFYLTVTQVGANPVADAVLLFEGNDVALNSSIEHLEALTLTTSTVGAGGPIAHWKLDDGVGTTAVDSVGGNDGTLVNGPVWTPGTIDGGLEFDGSNDHIRVSDSSDFHLADGTIQFWINADSISGEHYLFHKAGSEKMFVLIKSGEITFETNGDILTSPIQADQWYRVTITFGSEGMKLYLDGSLVASNAKTDGMVDNNDDIYIGADDTLGKAFDGTMDDIRIYDEALSAEEIAALGGSGGGGGGGGCNGTFRDEFGAQSFSGSDGTLAWAADWQEVGESNGATSGDIQVRNDQSNYQLRTRDNDNGGEGVEREADLSGAAGATLSYDYRRMNLDGSSDYTSVEVSANGASGPWTELTRHQGSGNDSNYQPASHNINSFISGNTRIRFKTSSSMGGTDTVWFDNVEISCTP